VIVPARTHISAVVARLEPSILTAPSDGARAAQLQLGLDLTQVNADGTTGLPMPAVIIAGAAGTIRWTDVHRDYHNQDRAPPAPARDQPDDRLILAAVAGHGPPSASVHGMAPARARHHLVGAPRRPTALTCV
jgi:hypothetical protein